jgi:hypothetical protein
MILLSFASGGCPVRAGPQFRRCLNFLGDSAFHAKIPAARHLPDHVLGLVETLNNYLVLSLRILVHFDYTSGNS